MRAPAGNTLLLEDDLDVGHLVIVTKRPSGGYTLRQLQASEADTFSGEVLRIEAGERPGERRLRRVRSGPRAV